MLTKKSSANVTSKTESPSKNDANQTDKTPKNSGKQSTSACSPTASQTCCANTTSQGQTSLRSTHEEGGIPQKKKGPITRITIKYDVGFSNSIYLRGKGANLSWDRGLVLKNIKSDEWVWETDAPFTSCEFKVLINDRQYELGENHTLQCGTFVQYTPKFSF